MVSLLDWEKLKSIKPAFGQSGDMALYAIETLVLRTLIAYQTNAPDLHPIANISLLMQVKRVRHSELKKIVENVKIDEPKYDNLDKLCGDLEKMQKPRAEGGWGITWVKEGNLDVAVLPAELLKIFWEKWEAEVLDHGQG
ncbi:MAG: hypothetical protein GKR97_12530 [Rhizobiaceae bacterium]|nr:hypothetical protein [Rhizobiaceae bacterium]